MQHNFMSSSSDRVVGKIFQILPDGKCRSAVSLLKGAIRRVVRIQESPHALITDVPGELAIAIPDVHRYARQLFQLDLEEASPSVKSEVLVLCALCSHLDNLSSETNLTTWKALLQGAEAAESAIARRPSHSANPGEA